MMPKERNGQFGQGIGKILSGTAAAFVAIVVLTVLPAVGAEDQAGIRATWLMDHPVVNADEEEIAEIDDLILKRNGKVKRVILSCCGILGLGGKKVAVPFRRLELDEEKIVYDISEEEFREKAEFDYREENLFSDYYARRPRMGIPEPPPYNPENPGYYDPYYRRYRPPVTPWQQEYYPWEWSYSPGRILGSVVLGRPVVNTQFQRIGFVDDLIISPQAEVKAVVLAVQALEEKELVSVPYKPFKITYWGLAYDASMKELRNMPEFHYEETE